MKTLAAAALLLAAGSAFHADQARADAPCAGQIHPNPGFERGATGWTAGPRMVVLGDETRPAHRGRAYATFGGLDVSRTDLLRTEVTVPAGCNLTVRFWVRTTTTAGGTSDYLNMGMAVSGEPPKTRHALHSDGPAYWYQYSTSSGAGAAERTAIISFVSSEMAGGGVTTYDLDDVTFTLS
ncbi:hypothetical protein [Actinoplanes sp. URMC 104]|uniref:hypothetical protein n=1 Tax=Actinoplanes sp. URMC 104 TaxID=3423409 RepID=UPI003F1DEB82